MYMTQEKTVLGFTEEIKIINNNITKTVISRIDTGATKSSIDTALAAKLGLGPVIGTKLVKSAHGNSIRPLVRVTIQIAGKTITSDFSITSRTHMKYPVLIGRNIIKQGFIIDPDKKRD